MVDRRLVCYWKGDYELVSDRRAREPADMISTDNLNMLEFFAKDGLKKRDPDNTKDCQYP